MKRRWAIFFATIGWLVLALVLLVSGVVLKTFWPDSEERKMEKIKTSMRNLESEVVRIELAGKNFDIPMRYFYGETIAKNWSWPTAKKERVKLDTLHLSVLLPDLRPYYPEDDARWKVLGHGDRVEVTIVKFRGPPENWRKGMEMNRAEIEADKLYMRSNDSFGLAKYSATGGLGDTLFSDDTQLQISCSRKQSPGRQSLSSPSCSVTSRYINNIDIEYYYGLNHLPHWREIDSGLKAMFDQFSINATESD